MFFLSYSKVNIWLIEQRLVLKSYTAVETSLTIKKMKIINKEKFAMAILNADNKTFIIDITALIKPIIMPIYFSYQV